MPQLIPVESDPFGETPAPPPINLVPVDHDPFAAVDAGQPSIEAPPSSDVTPTAGGQPARITVRPPYEDAGVTQFRAAHGLAPPTAEPSLAPQDLTLPQYVGRNFAQGLLNVGPEALRAAGNLQRYGEMRDETGAPLVDVNPAVSMGVNSVLGNVGRAQPGSIGIGGGKLVQPGETIGRIARGEKRNEPAIQDVPQAAAAPASEGANAYGRVARGARSLEEAERAAQAASGVRQPLEGLPRKPLDVGGEPWVPGPISYVHDAAERYMHDAGLPYNPIRTYQPVNEARATKIAKAFEDMPHAPNDPKVRASYDAMIDETVQHDQLGKV
jgi:hypothetical protein